MDRMDANEALSSLAIRWERLLFSLEKAAKTLAAFKDRDGDLSSSLLSIRDFGSSLLSPRVVQHKNSLVRLVAAVCAVELCRVFGSKVVFLPLETRQTLVRLFIGQLDFRETTRDEGSVIYRRRLWELLARSGAMAICSSHGEQLLTAVFDCAGYLNQSPSLANAAVKIVIDFVQENDATTLGPRYRSHDYHRSRSAAENRQGMGAVARRQRNDSAHISPDSKAGPFCP
ncbi:uncharacterized protein [Oscarella lobularis]|uniref:uncharacterized protein n=1 Tax=Oscarella lobularis TaxID=121494 RepID=UPI0033137A63